VSVCMCMHLCVCVYVYECVCVCVYMCVYVCVYLCMSIVNKGLKIVEVPIVVSYDGTESKTKAVPHGITVLMNVLKFMSIKHPIPSYGLPGVALLIIGTILGIQFFDVYFNQGTVFIGTLLGSIITFLVGAILVTTSILLFSMANLFREKY